MGESMKIVALMTALTTCAALGLSPLETAWAQDSIAENDRAVEMMALGQGVEKDPAAARDWYAAAAELRSALSMVKDLSADLRADIDAAKAEWIATIGKPDPAR